MGMLMSVIVKCRAFCHIALYQYFMFQEPRFAKYVSQYLASFFSLNYKKSRQQIKPGKYDLIQRQKFCAAQVEVLFYTQKKQQLRKEFSK